MPRDKSVDKQDRGATPAEAKAARPFLRAQNRVPTVDSFKYIFDRYSAVRLFLDPATGTVMRANPSALGLSFIFAKSSYAAVRPTMSPQVSAIFPEGVTIETWTRT